MSKRAALFSALLALLLSRCSSRCRLCCAVVTGCTTLYSCSRNCSLMLLQTSWITLLAISPARHLECSGFLRDRSFKTHQDLWKLTFCQSLLLLLQPTHHSGHSGQTTLGLCSVPPVAAGLGLVSSSHDNQSEIWTYPVQEIGAAFINNVLPGFRERIEGLTTETD